MASLVVQSVQNLPAMLDTWVRSLGWEDPLEKEKATHSSILAWRIPQTVEAMGSQRVGTRLSDFYTHTQIQWLLREPTGRHISSLIALRS